MLLAMTVYFLRHCKQMKFAWQSCVRPVTSLRAKRSNLLQYDSVLQDCFTLRFAMTITPMYSYWLNVYDYIPDIKTKIRTTGAINFSKILNAYPKNVSPKLSFQKFFMHQPAIKHINNVLNGNNIFDVV